MYICIYICIYHRTGKFRGWKFSRKRDSMYYVNNSRIFIFAVGGDRENFFITSSSAFVSPESFLYGPLFFLSALGVSSRDCRMWSLADRIAAGESVPDRLPCGSGSASRCTVWTYLRIDIAAGSMEVQSGEDKRQLYSTGSMCQKWRFNLISRI